jgi:hypothetical protein
VKLLFASSIACTAFVLLFFLKFPNAKLLMSSLLIELFDFAPWWIFLIGCALNAWILLNTWAFLVFYATIYLFFIFSIIFLLQEMG